MAINWNSTYTNTEPADNEYPFGGIKNATSPDVFDGTPLEKAGFSDLIGWMQAALKAAGSVPSGNPETAEASQILDAIINHKWYAFSNYVKGARVIGSNGETYRAVQANGPATTVQNPVTDNARTYWISEQAFFNDKAFPVGSIYISNTFTGPATTLGIGTWSLIQGRFIVGTTGATGDFPANSTGGSKSHGHGNTTAGGGHSHEVDLTSLGANGSGFGTAPIGRAVTGSGQPEDNEFLQSVRYSDTSTDTEAVGGHIHGVNSVETVPPYVAKYIWERTA